MSAKMRVKIPGGITPRHLAEVRKIMEDCLGGLNDSLKSSKCEVRQVNLRLNKSGTEDKDPRWIDWHGVDEVLEILKRDEMDLDPGLYRFGDGTLSEVNKEALDGAPNVVIERDWKTKGFSEKRPESRLLAQKAKVMYQKVIGIIVLDKSIGKNRCGGTFTMSLREKPDNNTITKIDDELKKIAGWDSPRASALCDWIEENVVVGGPFKP